MNEVGMLCNRSRTSVKKKKKAFKTLFDALLFLVREVWTSSLFTQESYLRMLMSLPNLLTRICEFGQGI